MIQTCTAFVVYIKRNNIGIISYLGKDITIFIKNISYQK